MIQCIRINCVVTDNKDALVRSIQKDAQRCSIEGTLKFEKDDVLHVVACGDKDNLEEFLDTVHKHQAEQGMHNLEIEPFLKDKDYRGVFRVIE